MFASLTETKLFVSVLKGSCPGLFKALWIHLVLETLIKWGASKGLFLNKWKKAWEKNNLKCYWDATFGKFYLKDQFKVGLAISLSKSALCESVWVKPASYL